jgi:hypothetical protein
VKRANEEMAIETLLITDALFRSQEITTRKKYVDLVEQVRENGGNVRVFSSLHVSGDKLGLLSGVAAILRFPLPELEVDDDEEDEGLEKEMSDTLVDHDKRIHDMPKAAAAVDSDVDLDHQHELEDDAYM